MISIREVAKKLTMDTGRTLSKDATYIPAEMLDWKPMEHGKSANEILSECARSNMALAAAIKGGTPSKASEEMDFSAPKDFVVASAEEVCAAIDSLSDEALEGDLQMPWGAIYAMVDAIILPAEHMGYHDGQINYIQVLLGDTAFHWAEE